MSRAVAMVGVTFLVAVATATACGNNSNSTGTGGSPGSAGASSQSGAGSSLGGSGAGWNANNAGNSGNKPTVGGGSGGNAGASAAGGNAAAGTVSSGGGASAGSNSAGGATSGTVIAGAFLCKPTCTFEQYCAIVAVDCGHAPCVVKAECRDVPNCTSQNGYQCPGVQNLCADDGIANCVASAQGTKCDGHCACKERMPCNDLVFDSRPEVCACVPPLNGFKSCLDFQCPNGYRCNEVLGTLMCVAPT